MTSADGIAFLINSYLAIGGVRASELERTWRLKICGGCEKSGMVELPFGELPGCTECGCPFETKTRFVSYFNAKKLKIEKITCPLGKWEGLTNLLNQTDMQAYDVNEAGLFRANEHAKGSNRIRMVDPTTPGTVEEDTGTIDTTAGVEFSGINYEGKDGVEVFIPFTREDQWTMELTPYTVQVTEGRAALRAAILELVERHEVAPIVNVTGATVNFIVSHIGAGTIHGVVMDGAEEALTRGAVGAGVEALAATKKAEAKKAKAEAAKKAFATAKDKEAKKEKAN